MSISSELLARNIHQNFDEVQKAEICLICTIQDNPTSNAVSEIDEVLRAENQGKVLPIRIEGDDISFSIILHNLTDGLHTVKRLLWEFGVILSSEIIMVQPELRILKDYGKGL